MASLNKVVKITIRANSRSARRASFGLPLFLSYHTVFPESYRLYGDIGEVEADGFALDSAQYRAAAALFAQSPRPAQVMIGRLSTAPVFTQVLTVTSNVQGQHIRLKAIAQEAGTITDPVTSGLTITPTGAVDAGDVIQLDYTIPAAQTLTQVATALETGIEALPGINSTSAVAAITATTATNGKKTFFYDLENVGVHETTADADYDDALAALATVNNGFYFILTDSESPANIAKVAAWTVTKTKLYFANTQSDLELDGTGTIGSDLKALSNTRTAILFHKNAHEFAAAAWVGAGATKNPGSINWANKTLAGVTFNELTETQEATLEADNINHYQSLADLGRTFPGMVASGEWIDVVHGTDALQADMQESTWTVIANNDKVAYTASGQELILNALRGALKRAEGTNQNPGLLTPGTTTVEAPDPLTANPADRKSRVLKSVTFYGKYASAINAVEVEGTFEY